MIRGQFRRLFLAATLMLSGPAAAADITVGVPAGSEALFNAIKQAFEGPSGHKLTAAIADEDGLVALVRSGTGPEILLALPRDRLRKLEDEGLAVAGERFTIAIGRLMLWSPEARPMEPDQPLKLLEKQDNLKIGLLRSDRSPYGAASVTALRNAGIWEKLGARAVQYGTLGELMEAAKAKAVDLVLGPANALRAQGTPLGSQILLPRASHEPIRHDVALMKRGVNSRPAHDLLRFLDGIPGQDAAVSAGYDHP